MRGAHNRRRQSRRHSRALLIELLPTGLLRRDMASPFVASTQWRKGVPMTNGQSTAVMAVFALRLAFAPAASADFAGDACTALSEARVALYFMINAKTKAAQDEFNAKVQAASTKLISCLPA